MAINILLHRLLTKVRVQAFAKLDIRDVALHLAILFILRNEGPSEAGFLHRLETNDQQVEKEVHLFDGYAQLLLDQERAQHIRLRTEQLIYKSLLLLHVHRSNCDDSLDKGSVPNAAH